MTALRLAALLLMAATVTAFGQDYRVGDIAISGPWTRATPTGVDVTAGYMRVTNFGSTPDRLLGGRAAIAGAFDVQEMMVADNVVRLRTLARGVEIKPGETLELKPGSAHSFILSSLATPLKPGDRVRATLLFENAGAVDIDYVVQPANSRNLLPHQAQAE